ncbi:hypothetical protein SteCoe_8598 [Stentor coeruleus]|uniref:Uncharacterized protein n=1 Tax=Stentor coeruleus TaxID=5963 RepID=A0A1R2CK22_9CILI|nr:hypothetical protein SteCoe_8598 [Stentor coeruleus]
MLSWLIPKNFICGLLFAGILKSFNTSSVLHARLLYIILSLFLAIVSLFIKLFAHDAYSKFGFLMPICPDYTCFTSYIIHAIMLSLSIFHFCILALTLSVNSIAFACYQKCWVLKFILYFAILIGCIWFTNILDYYSWIAFGFIIGFIGIQSIYLIEFNYDWSEAWFEYYNESSSKYWATMLIIFSIISWIFNVGMLIITYFISKHFWVSLLNFVVSVSITIFSSSSLCQNGSLLSSSLTMAFATYFLTTAFLINPKDKNYLIIFLDIFLSLISLCYLAFVQPEKHKTNSHSEFKHSKIANFSQKNQEDDFESKEKSKPNTILFQITLASYCFYLGMILTDWELALNDNRHFTAKCLQAMLIMSFYLWTLIAPLLFPDREFSR